MEIRRVEELLNRFREKRILVIGDVMLDEFIWGKVSRISPEAPVPVVEVTGESFYPGGAANVARNLKQFCDKASVLALVGADRHGRQLLQIMRTMNLSLGPMLEDRDYQTIVKTRIVARQQQLVRVDREVLKPLAWEVSARALERLQEVLPKVDAVIFEDYAKGFLGEEFVRLATQRIVAAGKVVTADPNPKNPLSWSGLTAIKPNRAEAFRCAGVEENDPEEDFTERSRLPEVSARLLKKWSAKLLLITLGEHGMMLFENGKEPYHVPTRAQEVYDVSGAGDTAIALFTLALASGATAQEAAEISNHASSVVVGKLGTATLTSEELLASFERHATDVEGDVKEVKQVKKVIQTEKVLVVEPVVEPLPKIVKPQKLRKERIPIEKIVPEVLEKPLPTPPSAKKPIWQPEYKPARRRDFDYRKPAVFLDRDGTLMEEVDYCGKPEDVHVFPNVPNSLYRLQQAGYLVVVVTNQAGIGRGKFTEEDYWKVHAEFIYQIGGNKIDFTYFCPDHPDQATDRRKPGIRMIQQAQADLNIDLKRSWLIGDKASDIQCGKNAELKTILVATGYGKDEVCQPDYRARDFASAVDIIVVE